MSSYNHVTLVGLVYSEIKTTTTKAKATTSRFTLAVERFVSRNKTETDYFNIVAHGKLGEVVGDYLKPGRKCLIDGHIQVRKLKETKTDIAGNESPKWITEVVAENVKFLSRTTAA